MIGVGGCVASQGGRRHRRPAPFVDVVFGPQTLHRLPQLIAERKARGGRPSMFPSRRSKVRRHAAGRGQGASASCRSWKAAQVLHLLHRALHPGRRGVAAFRGYPSPKSPDWRPNGVKEVTLLGQNVNAYRGDMAEEQADLALLIEYIAEVPGIERIRYTTSHPRR